MKHALNGIRLALRERSMRIHLCVAFYVVAVGFIVQLGAAEWRAALLCIALVLGMECLNTGLEALCNAVMPGKNALVKAAKDVAAGGVLICAAIAAVVGGHIFFHAATVMKVVRFITGSPILFCVLALLLPVWVFFIIRSQKDDQ